MSAGAPHTDAGRVGFDENTEFNQYLDETNGDIEVQGFQYRPSEVLYRLDYDAYLDLLVDFRQVQAAQLMESVVSAFPTPVALAFRRSQKGAQNANQKVLYLRDTWEALINSLFAIAMGELRVRGSNRPLSIGNRVPSRRELLSDRLGLRLDLVEEVRRLAEDHSEPWLISAIASEDAVPRLRSLNQLRNRVSHTSTMAESHAESLYLENIDTVLAALDDARELENARFLRFLGTNANLAAARCEVFAGFQTERTIEDVELPVELLPTLAECTRKSCILLLMDNEVVSLAPYLHFRDSLDGSRTELCFFKQARAGVMEYEAVGSSGISDYGLMSVDAALFADEIAVLQSVAAGSAVPVGRANAG